MGGRMYVTQTLDIVLRQELPIHTKEAGDP